MSKLVSAWMYKDRNRPNVDLCAQQIPSTENGNNWQILNNETAFSGPNWGIRGVVKTPAGEVLNKYYTSGPNCAIWTL
jgi:hypothetical protein